MMKFFLLIACFLLVACGYDESASQREKYTFWAHRSECCKDYSKKLETEIKILKVKMEYGCKEPKDTQ